MNLKQTHLSRTIFTKNSSKGTPAQTIAIKAKNFKRFKVFAITATVALVFLVWLVADLTQHSREQDAERAKLVQQINSLNAQVGKANTMLDSVTTKQLTSDEKALTYIGNIEQKLTRINDYLSRRGLHGFSFKRVSPAGKDRDKAAEKLYSNYDSYLTRLVNSVGFMPMGYPRISAFTSFFGYRGNPFDFGNSEFHPGIDFRGKVGDPVKCTASGTVEFAGPAGGYGNCVRIKHINNIETLYGHMSKILVRRGQQVSVGEVIGKVGSTGRSTGAHLHYEVRQGGKAVNPKAYLTLN